MPFYPFFGWEGSPTKRYQDPLHEPCFQPESPSLVGGVWGGGDGRVHVDRKEEERLSTLVEAAAFAISPLARALLLPL